MALFTFWQGDVHTTPKGTSALSIQKEYDVNAMTSLMNLEPQRIEQRFRGGDEAWVAKLEGSPVSFGWVSHGRARIGELSKEIEVPKRNAYLWNFRTLEAFRGRGYYVQLLHGILLEEITISDKIWIISAPENQSSYNGIVKAGFQVVGDIMFNYENEVVLLAKSEDERTRAGANLIRVPITTTQARPCWRCASKAMNREAACDCYENHLPCRCKKQREAPANAMSQKGDL